MTAFRCKACGGVQTEVVDTRRAGAYKIRRRRKCRCGHRFTTMEIPVEEYEIINLDGGVVARLGRDARRVVDVVETIAAIQKAQRRR